MNRNLVVTVGVSVACGYLLYRLWNSNKRHIKNINKDSKLIKKIINKEIKPNEDGILSLNDLQIILSEINKTIEPIYLKLLENRKEILSSYRFSERKLNALLMEEFKKSLGEVTVSVYKKYKTNSEIISKSSKNYKNIKEYKHLAYELVNMEKSLKGESQQSVEIPSFLTKDFALLIYDKSLAAICDSMKEAILEKCDELGLDFASFVSIMNSNADIMVDINNKYYPLVSIRHLMLYREYKVTELELQTALRLYANSDPYYTDKLDYVNSKHKKIMNEFTGAANEID